MSSFWPRSTSLARVSIRAYRRSHITTRVSRISPAALLSLRKTRYYSDDKKPPFDDGKKQPPFEASHDANTRSAPEIKNSKNPGPSEGEAPARNGESTKPKDQTLMPEGEAGMSDQSALPEGWVRLSGAEYEELKSIFANKPDWTKSSVEDELLGLLRKRAPIELQQLIRKKMSGDVSIADVARLIAKVHSIVSEMTVEFAKQRKAGKEGRPKPQPKDPKDGDETETQGRQARSDNQDHPGPGSKGGNWQKKEGKPSQLVEFIVTALATGTIFWLYDSIGGGSREITWQELRTNFLDKGLVEKLIVSGSRVKVELDQDATREVYPDSVAGKPGFRYYFNIGSVDAFERHLDEAQDELQIPSDERIPVSYQADSSALTDLFFAFGPTIFFVALLVWASRRAGGGGGGASGMFGGFSKSKAKRFNHETAVKIKFADIAGMDEAKAEIVEFVNFLKQPDKFAKLGAKIPRGAILSGPPGTGKTMLAKATAGESGVPFFSATGSEFVEMFVGVGASRVRDLFATAKRNTPCIIFIDEIDAIGRSRDGSGGFRSGGNDERESTLNQILTEMDGFDTSAQVVVLAGTNRADVLDKALMRPGRFDRHIYIDAPTLTGRQEIFKVYLRKVVTREDLESLSGRLAALTPGFVGADIANCVNEAALVAARANAESISLKHFEQAIERVVGGLERKSLVMNPTERKTVAYHEAGHAICGWFFEWADPLLKVSIVPRGRGVLGYAQYLPGDVYLMTEKQLLDRMAMTLGGRISEELHFDTVTTGASDDFKKVTEMATSMVTQWGMSEKLGPLHFNMNNNGQQIYKPFAELTAQTIDSEVRRIVDQAYKQCKDLLVEKKKEVGMVAEELLKAEVLTRDDMVRLLGQRPFAYRESFTKYFGEKPTEENGPPPPSPAGGEGGLETPPVPPQPAIFGGLQDEVR